MPGTPPDLIQPNTVTDFIQANSLEDEPFLCMAGVREYHDNPAHSGDPWLLHRGSGEGRLEDCRCHLRPFQNDRVRGCRNRRPPPRLRVHCTSPSAIGWTAGP
ncbi:putative metal-binding protein [Rhizobium mesoamericanum]|uniref:putative metal-binding protein n=1 Tax=Rhizobium mesoamericanum TaxID=1079800 RepID=UPI0027D8F223|nr:putative metal-binding protein [Rhizobium mesoamericanum]